MRKNKKILMITSVFLITLNIVACGQVKEDSLSIEDLDWVQYESDLEK